MPPEYNFPLDAEFSKILARDGNVRLPIAALELARDDDPLLDFQRTVDWLESRGDELRGPAARAKSDCDLLGRLIECLAGRHGLGGDGSCFDQAECSFLNRVIETGRGIPISLAVIYMAVAEAARVSLSGVSAPLHFLTRYETGEGPLFLDGFTGRVLTRNECLRWLAAVTNCPRGALARTLDPVGPRQIVVRMLNNLKRLHALQGAWEAAWNVQRRLAALHPGSYEQRRDLAVVALNSGRAGTAVDLLGACLETCPPDERGLLQSRFKQATALVARWN